MPTFGPRELKILIESAARVERNRIYVGVKALYTATHHPGSHGKAQRVAYRRVLDVILKHAEAE